MALDERTGKILWTQGNGPPATPACPGRSGRGRRPPLTAIASTWSARTGRCSASTSRTARSSGRQTTSPTSRPTARRGHSTGALRARRWSMGPAAGSAWSADSPDAKVVAFDKMTGKELWRALNSTDSDLGVAQPIIITAGGGTRQLIIWYPGAVVALDPETGKQYWEQPYKVGGSMTVVLPVQTGSDLFFTTFYDGPLMLTLDDKRPSEKVAWKGKSDSEILTDGLHAVSSRHRRSSAITSTASTATVSSAACARRPASASGRPSWSRRSARAGARVTSCATAITSSS